MANGGGEASDAASQGTDPLAATRGTERPADIQRLMEEVCQRENLNKALREVKVNKGSAGEDGHEWRQGCPL